MNTDQKKELRQEIRQSIQKTHYDLLGSSLDSKTVSYWERSIMSEDKTMQNFVEFVTSKPEYKIQMKSRFANMYYDIIGYDLDNEVIEDFVNGHFKKQVTANDMKTYITELPLFNEKYTDLIQNVYMKIYDEAPAPEIIDFYMKTLKLRDEYDIDRLYDDMTRKVHEHPDELSNYVQSRIVPERLNEISVQDAQEKTQDKTHTGTGNNTIVMMDNNDDHLINFITQSYEVIFRRQPSSQIIDKVREFYFNPAKLIQLMHKHDDAFEESMSLGNMCDIDYRQLQAFEQVFERPMYVHEYFKYIIRRTSDTPLNYQTVFEDFMSRFTRLRSIVKNYLNEVLEEYDLCRITCTTQMTAISSPTLSKTSCRAKSTRKTCLHISDISIIKSFKNHWNSGTWNTYLKKFINKS